MNTSTARLRAPRRCPRGHYVTGANVVPSSARRGYPECRVCHRAQGDAFNIGRRKGVYVPLEDAVRGQLKRIDRDRLDVALAAIYNLHAPATDDA
ncbi:hypothetical protein FHX52_1054 [Humibacillus xanthopallidus]|uniref:Uncharacterized protein n=1 Tax=Humibacillus xanthopallidus TaxID=412689 RepID=A0A543PV32_9MICO|nr:hypothetical protein [Humibacillus xanthopallidus]TQN47935.1 hypothetical protein FHX52_1054 [Humibacillus xanthopallidus]